MGPAAKHPVEHLVVVGASLAGLKAVETARRDGFGGRLTLVGAEPHPPYDRPPLSKAWLAPAPGAAQAPEPPALTSRDELTRRLGVELLLGEPATRLDPGAREVMTAKRRIPFDALVLATGSTARRLPADVAPADLRGVHTLRTVDDARAVRDALDAGARALVVGGGFIGAEVASAARARGQQVSIVEAAPTPLARVLGEQMGRALSALHARHGTRLLCGRTVVAMHGAPGPAGRQVCAVELDDGSVLPADVVVVGIGAVPETSWLEGSGLTLSDGVVCDETLSTGLPRVFAAGDVARWPNSALGSLERSQNWTTAAEQGAHAARAALSPIGPPVFRTVPYAWSDWYDTRIQVVGTCESDEVRLVDGDPARDWRWVALYRRGERLVGALAVNAPTEVMRYRRLIDEQADWERALARAAARCRSQPLG